MLKRSQGVSAYFLSYCNMVCMLCLVLNLVDSFLMFVLP